MISALLLASLCAAPNLAAENQALKAVLALPPEVAPKVEPEPVVAPSPAAVVATPIGMSDSSSSATWLFPSLALLGLAGAAFAFAKKRGKTTRLIQVLETAGLGPKRSLVVAKVGEKTMLLGASEAGIALLTIIEEPLAPQQAAPTLATEKEGGANQASLLKRLIGVRRPIPVPAAFDELMVECAEDQDLRRKLEKGLAGRVS